MGQNKEAGKSVETAVKSAMNYLAVKDRSSQEVRLMLEKKGYGVHEINSAMEYLITKGFVNHLRYAEYYIAEAFEKGKSKKKTEMELREKGIEDSDISAALALQQSAPSEEEKAIVQAERMMSEGELSPKTLRKIGSRLGYLGFEEDLIYEILEKLSERGEL